jgi:hypothetical protein
LCDNLDKFLVVWWEIADRRVVIGGNWFKFVVSEGFGR